MKITKIKKDEDSKKIEEKNLRFLQAVLWAYIV